MPNSIDKIYNFMNLSFKEVLTSVIRCLKTFYAVEIAAVQFGLYQTQQETRPGIIFQLLHLLLPES